MLVDSPLERHHPDQEGGTFRHWLVLVFVSFWSVNMSSFFQLFFWFYDTVRFQSKLETKLILWAEEFYKGLLRQYEN